MIKIMKKWSRIEKKTSIHKKIMKTNKDKENIDKSILWNVQKKK